MEALEEQLASMKGEHVMTGERVLVAYERGECAKQKPQVRSFHTLYEDAFAMTKGEEIGYFSFGSTIVLLFESSGFTWAIDNGHKVKMGQALGEIVDS